MRASHVRLTLGKELRESLRDRRILAVMILFPLVVYPLLSLLAAQVANSRERARQTRPSLVAVTGEGVARDALVAKLREQPKIFTLVPQGNRADVTAGKLDGLVQIGEPNRAEIVYDAGRDDSREAVERLSDVITAVLPAGCAPLFTVAKHSVAREAEVGGYLLSKALPLLLVLMVLLGAFHPAIDVTAGERERGTLETILSSPIRRFDLLLGKVLAVTILAALTGFLNLASMSATLIQVLRLADPGSTLSVPWTRAAAAAWVILPIAFLFASVFVAVGATARGFKDAQHLLTPVYFLSIAPAIAGALGEYRLAGLAAWIPCMNVTLLARDLLLGQATLWGVLVVLISTLACGCAGLAAAAHIYSSERFVDAGARDRKSRRPPETSAATPGRAMFLFGVAFVLLYFVWMPLQRRHLVFGLLASEWGGLFGLVGIYALFTRQSWAGVLHLVRPSSRSWLGASLVGLSAWAGVAVLSDWISPVPKEVIEQMRRSLIPTDGSRGLLGTLALVALTPAICEEALFRGPILRGLRSRASAAVAVILTGLLFGIFHIELSRILPTALLGILLSQLALKSGSILPAMLAHFLNNASLVLLAYFHVDDKVTEVGTVVTVLILVVSVALTALGLRLVHGGGEKAKV
ncbi:MAG TPA: ABC transporter permease subunit/CPBP intramembrane protease [Polyangia bacterium]